MHISHIHKTRENNYLENKHTLAKLLMTYTGGTEFGGLGPHSFTVTIEDFKTVESAFIQVRKPDGNYYSDPGVAISGNQITITEETESSNPFLSDGAKVFMRIYGTR